MAAEWLDHLPFTRTYTAERVAYRNLVHGLVPPGGLGWLEARDATRHATATTAGSIPSPTPPWWLRGCYGGTATTPAAWGSSRPGWDTDSNGATAGSVFGELHGAWVLPPAWVEPLGDLAHSAIFGFDNSRISDLAERTLRLALRSAARAHG